MPDRVDQRFPPELDKLAKRAYTRMGRGLRVGAPTLADHALEWTRLLSGHARPESYFTHADAFPMLLLPWWLEGCIRGEPAEAFHADVVYSTMTGYYFVRMIDDLMDRDRVPRPEAVPALIFFHTEFHRTYHRHFAQGHPFWDALNAASLTSAETASKDAGLAGVSREQFIEISARKIAGARIPIAAVCHRYDRQELIGQWYAFVDLLGRWHQMLNDILGWNRDLAHGRRTYFLTEAQARAGDGGSVAEWVIADGLDWGLAELDAWMGPLLAAGAELDSTPVVAYLEDRRRSLVDKWEDLAPSIEALRRLASTLR